MMSVVMPIPVVLASVSAALLLFTALLIIFRRVQYRVQVGRELHYLIGQKQFDYTIIDIRGGNEFVRGHIPNALNIPYQQCLGYMPTENMFEKIFVYGRNRRSARRAALSLSSTGYFSVKYFGPFRCWKGPVEITSAETKEIN
jgi:rhodanese-related sulfurtransferase